MVYKILHDLALVHFPGFTTSCCVTYDHYTLNSMNFFPFFELVLASRIMYLFFLPLEDPYLKALHGYFLPISQII